MDIIFTLQSTSDGSLMTGQAANITVYLSVDGGNYAASTNAAQEIGRGAYKVTLTSAEAAFQTLLYAPVCAGAQSNIYQLDAAPTIPSASDNAQAVWGAQTKEVTIATAQADTFATASALTTVGNNVSAVKAKTDNLPALPAAVGSEMALNSTAISAVQNGLATSSDLSALETHGDSSWATATGFATPSDLTGLSTFNAATDTVTINSTQAAGMATATGFATPSDLASAVDSLEIFGQQYWQTANLSGLATSSQLSTATDVITAAMPDVSGLSTFDPSTDKVTLNDTEDGTLSAIKTKVDTLNNTDLTGIATSTNVSDAKAEIISAIPNDYAKPGNAMTLTSSTLASVIAGVWNYDNRELTQEIVSQITAEDIASISIAVWSYVPRKLTSIVSDVIEPNK